MALPRRGKSEEQKPPCDTGCGEPYKYAGFWGKRLCEDCWDGWRKAFDVDFDARGGKSHPEPGILFEEWFAQRQEGRAA